MLHNVLTLPYATLHSVGLLMLISGVNSPLEWPRHMGRTGELWVSQPRLGTLPYVRLLRKAIKWWNMAVLATISHVVGLKLMVNAFSTCSYFLFHILLRLLKGLIGFISTNSHWDYETHLHLSISQFMQVKSSPQTRGLHSNWLDGTVVSACVHVLHS